MPDVVHNTIDHVLLINDQNIRDYGISDIASGAPLLAVLATDFASHGTKHQYRKETGAPVVGFRAVNAGRAEGKSSDVGVSIDLQILSANDTTDMKLASAHKRGAAAYVALELERKLRAALAGAERQILFGTDSDEDGFIGLAQAFGDTDNDMVIDAGAADENALTSIWLISSTADNANCSLILGNDGQIALGETVVQRVVDGDGNPYPAYFTPQEGWLGLQIGSRWSIARIANIGAATQIDDDLIASAMDLFPAGREPGFLVMNKNVRRRWAQSRTATNATGAPAPLPTEFEGATVVPTPNLTATEAQLVAAA